MRRWFSILLLVLLPVQLVWAGVAPYCQHEESVTAQHFGHHQHDDGAAVSEPPAPESGFQYNADHADCSVCQLGSSTLMSFQLDLPAVTASSVAIPGESRRLSGGVHYPLERPNWVRLA